MSSKTENAGRGMSKREYDEGIERIHRLVVNRAGPEDSDEVINDRAAKLEFQLLIDYRLGAAIPLAIRAKLVKIHAEICNLHRALANQYYARDISYFRFRREAARLADEAASRCAGILSDDEYKALFGCRKGKRPVAPFRP
jgi:hypothetical protein